MPAPLFIAAAGAQLAGTAANWWMGSKAVDEQERMALEEARALARRNDQTLGLATAAGHASGFEGGESASIQAHLGAMAAEFRRQNELAVRAARKGASLGRQTNLWQGLTGFASSAFNLGANMGWFKGGPAGAEASASGRASPGDLKLTLGGSGFDYGAAPAARSPFESFGYLSLFGGGR